MKRLISTMLSVCLACSMGTSALAANNDSAEVYVSGISMTAEEFKNVFGVAPEKQVSFQSVTDKNSGTEMSLNNIMVNGDLVNLNLQLLKNGEVIDIPITGKLGAGYKNEHNINSVIVQVDNSDSAYDVLLFEIFNDDEENNLLVDNTLEGQPHLKVYIQDEYDNIYLFESDVPESLSNLNANDYPKADKYSDILWATDLVEHDIQIVPTDTEILESLGMLPQTKGLNSWTTWTNSVTYTDAFNVGADYTKFTSLPYINYRHTNVGEGDNDWIASFRVAEHASANGYTFHGNNVFDYRNLKLSFGTGDKTTITLAMQDGRVYDRNKDALLETGERVVVDLFKNAVSSLPAGSTITTVLEAIRDMDSSGDEVELGAEGIDIQGTRITAVGEELDSKYSIEECTDYDGETDIGHYFTYLINPVYEVGGGKNSTVGALEVEFDPYHKGDGNLGHVKKHFTLNYTVNE